MTSLRARFLAAAARAMSPGQRAGLLSLGFAAAAAYMYLAFVRSMPDVRAPVRMPFIALVLCFAASELFVIHLRFGKEAHSISVSDVPLVLGLLLAGDSDLVLARVIGSAVGLGVGRRQPLQKLFFNLSLFAFQTSLAVVLFRTLLGGSTPLDPKAWLAVLFTTLVSDAVGAVAVSAVIYLYTRQLARDELLHALASGGASVTLNTAFAVVSTVAVWAQPRAVVPLAILSACFLLVYRTFGRLSERHANLELLWDFSKGLSGSSDMRSIAAVVADRIRDVLQAETAEVVLLDAPDERELRVASGSPAQAGSAHRRLEGALLREVLAGRSVLMPRGSRDLAIRDYLGARALRDCMISPLVSGATVRGWALVADRLGDTGSFDRSHLRLLETLANQAAVSLDRGRLVDSLQVEAARNEYQAQHDLLTGLYNRSHLRVLLEEMLSSRNGSGIAVILMDLDRFKEINDTLGHHMGDDVLRMVGERLRATMRAGIAIARLGGDEFAMVVPHEKAEECAVRLSEEIASMLGNPFKLKNLNLEVRASMGVAVAPVHGRDPDTLMQHADVAMYIAKENHTGVQVYDEALDRHTAERLTLLGELRAAIDAGGLDVHYQPKVDLRSEQVVGLEALVRWSHPRIGMVRPDEFISLAEHAGLIGDLTDYVLESSLRQVARWRDCGLAHLHVAINLSARTLVDPNLPDHLAELLRRLDLPAEALQIEITESSIMSDFVRATEVLEKLKAIGIEAAIDDFGTGHSSLAYLKRLPVRTVKIDRSFVMGMSANSKDAAIIDSIIHLARTLGLATVAEGIEDAGVMGRLRSGGCDIGQGYYIGRPQPASEIERWMLDRTPVEATVAAAS